MVDTADGSPDLFSRTTQQITRALIRSQMGRLVMLHAGAVAHPVTGRSLVYVAPGGTGKTTLTRVLGRRFGYLTDETVAIDEQLRVLPYPKPLSERHVGPSPKRERSPIEAGLLPAPAASRVGRVILLDRVDGLGAPGVIELGLLDAIEALVAQSSALYMLNAGLHRLAQVIEASGPVLLVHYSEASSLAQLAEELIGEAT